MERRENRARAQLERNAPIITYNPQSSMATPGSTPIMFWNSLTQTNRPLWQGTVVPGSNRANQVYHASSLMHRVSSSNDPHASLPLPGGHTPLTHDQHTYVSIRGHAVAQTEGLLALLDKVVRAVKALRPSATPGRTLWPDNYTLRPVWPYDPRDRWEQAVAGSRVSYAPSHSYGFEITRRDDTGIQLMACIYMDMAGASNAMRAAVPADGVLRPNLGVIISSKPEFGGLGWERYVKVIGLGKLLSLGGHKDIMDRDRRMIRAAVGKIVDGT